MSGAGFDGGFEGALEPKIKSMLKKMQPNAVAFNGCVVQGGKQSKDTVSHSHPRS